MFLAVFLILLNLGKIWLARFLPLLGDEAYYALWSQNLALSYNDHPPMIAFFHLLTGQTELGVRLVAIICVLISTWLIYLIGKETFGKKAGVASAVLFNIIPTYLAGGFFLTPEQPLLIFWLLSMYWTVRIFKTQQKRYWYALGLSLGLALLSKYTMFPFILGLSLFLILSPDNRRWLKQKEPYLATIIALVLFSPVIVWNIQQGFSSFTFHGGRLGSPDYLNNIFYFLILQFVMFTPPLFIFTVKTFFYEIWHNYKLLDKFSLLLICLSLPAFAAFVFVSPFTMIGGHWTSIAYLGIVVIMAHRLISLNQPFKKIAFWFNLVLIILINTLFISYYAFLFPVPKEIKTNAYQINRQLPDYIRRAKVDYVFSNQMGVGSLVAFYGQTGVALPKGYWKQFDIWGQPQLKKGDDVLYFAFGDDKMPKKLKKVFAQVKVDQQIRLFAKDSGIPEKTKAILCRSYTGGKLP